MNKSEFIAEIAEKSGLKKKDTALFVDTMIDVVKDTLKEREKIQLIGFGSFESKIRTERTGRNPKTGEEISIPEKVMPTFKAGKPFKAFLNQ